MGRWDDWKSEKSEKDETEKLPPVEVEEQTTKAKIETIMQSPLQNIDESLLFIKIPNYKQIVDELNKLDVSLKEISQKIIELEKQKEEEMLSIESIKQKIVGFEGILIELDKRFGGRLE